MSDYDMQHLNEYITSRMVHRQVHMVWGLLIWTPGLAVAAQVLTSSRAWGADSQELGLTQSGVSGALAHWITLGILLFMLGLGGLSVAWGLIVREGRLPRAGLALWLGAMTYALVLLLSARFGLHPDFYFGLLGLPVVFTAIYLLPAVSPTWFAQQTQKVLLLFAYGSLLAALVAPRWAVEYPYTLGLVPGFDIRLHGLALHANLLAPLLLTYLILGWLTPPRTRWGNVHFAVVLLTLILTQSKTVWVLLVVAYMFRWAYLAWSLPKLQRYATLFPLGAVTSGGILLLTNWSGWREGITVLLLSPDLPTLTGRTMIWRVTLDVWEQSPWFGYGPTLWNQQMGLAYAPLMGHIVPHAHNEFFQALGTAGIIGVAGLILYAPGLLAYGLCYAKPTNGVAFGLVLVTWLRGLTEPTLGNVPGTNTFYLHFVTFSILILAARQKRRTDGTRGPHEAS